MFDFREQVVVITGAAGNLGQATASAFAAAGARLVLVDRRAELLEDRFPDLAASDEHLFTAVDLTDSNAVEALGYEIVQQAGRVDVLANIAGGFRSGPPVHETSPEMWDFLMDLNARTVLNTARAFIPHMWQQQHGKVINIAARAARSGSKEMAAYVASKSAVMRLTESMSAELKSRGINVNCIMPGTIDTPENRRAMPNAAHEKWVPPAAIADVILFLASDAARALHGACIPVYGLS
jgi:NAD(P)-dependent dehydrogenase (short-subunit alcohol dehydrogenase family)